MNEQFTIQSFIENRWVEANNELQRLNRGFIEAVKAYGNLMDKDFVLPELTSVSSPKRPLGRRLYELLETTFEIAQELKRVETTTSLAQDAETRRISWYYYNMWVQNAFNLSEKVKLLITRTTRLYKLGNQLKQQYHTEIDHKVQDELAKRRNALVHGADSKTEGGMGVYATVITDHPLGWNICIVIGPEIIPAILDSAYSLGRTPAQYAETLTSLTQMLKSALAGVLSDFDGAIIEAVGSA